MKIFNNLLTIAVITLGANAQAQTQEQAAPDYDALLAITGFTPENAPSVGLIANPLTHTYTYDVYFSDARWKEYVITYKGDSKLKANPTSKTLSWMFIPKHKEAAQRSVSQKELPQGLMGTILKEAHEFTTQQDALSNTSQIFDKFKLADPTFDKLPEIDIGVRCSLQSNKWEVMNFTSRKMYISNTSCNGKDPQMLSIVKHTENGSARLNIMSPSANILKQFLEQAPLIKFQPKS